MKIKATLKFDRKLKRLKRKYASLPDEIGELACELRRNPTMGTPIGHSCYKIRLAIKSKGKGKSGGVRVITHYFVHGETVYLLSIYDKLEQVTLTDGELTELLASVDDL